jgi:hypothetical protein
VTVALVLFDNLQGFQAQSGICERLPGGVLSDAAEEHRHAEPAFLHGIACPDGGAGQQQPTGT